MPEKTITLRLNEGDTAIIRTAKQREAYCHRRVKQDGRLHEGKFTFADLQHLATVTLSVDPVHLGYLLVIQTYIDYETGILVSGRQKRHMTRPDLRDVLKLSRPTFNALYANLERHGIICEDAEGRICVNETYHFRGTALGRDRLIKLYDVRIRKLRDTAKAVKQLGYLYRVLPYVHFRDNVLCWNPAEPDPDKIQAINKSALAAIMGVDVKTSYRLIKTLMVDDLYVFAEVTSGRDSTFIIVNPWICNRGDYPITLDSIFRCKIA
ncbi:hypothetical protein [Paenibacillus xylanexedens]|uniref:hypothetical protein n=1 Tax=Paenibacillus xylanexedens TaxID=528191 RepID=UPI000F546F57|nr:hypothetical protein [Paenibacillus xylanexedens]RPK16428.1 hypothetical protein EDO6_03089 [Paenibacillus xylanexedens]